MTGAGGILADWADRPQESEAAQAMRTPKVPADRRRDVEFILLTSTGRKFGL
jgi:hypothetical protein